jgi:Tol biopolymer transport system component
MRFVFEKRFVGLIAAAVVLAATAAASQTGAVAAQTGAVAAQTGATRYTGTIAFVRDGEGDALYVIHADGSGLRRITPPGVSGYKWSPNGRLIAYIGGPRGSLWLVRPDGTGLRRLLRGSDLASMGLSWSPDGKKIAITSPGPFAKEKTAYGCVVHVVPIHGSHQWKLRDTSGASCDNPAWSPRGDEIAYSGDQDSIWVIHPDGRDDRPVVEDRPIVDLAGGAGAGPHWSSDGRQFVFSVARGPLGLDPYSGFAAVNSDGTHYHVVTRQAYTEYGEVWSPHGRRILYGHANGGIYVIGSNRQNNRRVTTDSPGQSEAAKLAWSPDSRSIVYAPTQGGLYEVGINGRGEVQLTSPGHGDLDPSWVAQN